MEYTESIRNKYSLESLEYHVRIGSSQGYLEDILNNLEEEDLLEACIICQGSIEAVKRYSLCLLQKVGMETIALNLRGFLEALIVNKDGLHQTCLDCLKKVDSEWLNNGLGDLLLAIRSDFFMVRFYGEELISIIKPEHLKLRKRMILSEYDSIQENCQPDYRRVINYLMVNILEEFDLLDVYENKQLLQTLAQSDNQKLKEAARFNLLRMIKEDCHNNESFHKLMVHWKFLSDCEASPVIRVEETATLIKLDLIERFSIRRKEDNINYLINLQKSGNKEIRGTSRKIALDILEKWPKENLFKYRNFLIRCQESKSPLARSQAKGLIEKITNYQWSQDVEGLLNWHLSGFTHVRRTVRKILVRLPDLYLSKKILPALLDAQRSVDPVQRKLSLILANKISQEELRKAKKVIKEASGKRQKNKSSLATSLLEKVS